AVAVGELGLGDLVADGVADGGAGPVGGLAGHGAGDAVEDEAGLGEGPEVGAHEQRLVALAPDDGLGVGGAGQGGGGGAGGDDLPEVRHYFLSFPIAEDETEAPALNMALQPIPRTTGS